LIPVNTRAWAWIIKKFIYFNVFRRKSILKIDAPERARKMPLQYYVLKVISKVNHESPVPL
jgi:hypothetical protein